MADSTLRRLKVELLSPKRFAMSGRATMVWNESIYLSMRMFGFFMADSTLRRL